MKTAIRIVLMLTLVAMYGCDSQSNSSRGGGMTKDVGFKIAVPTYDKDVRQGGVRAVTVSLVRGSYFKEDVKLQMLTTGGISIEPTAVLIKANESPDVQLRITTTKDTALGSYNISVMGTPETGEPTSTAFTVKVVSP